MSSATSARPQNPARILIASPDIIVIDHDTGEILAVISIWYWFRVRPRKLAELAAEGAEGAEG